MKFKISLKTKVAFQTSYQNHNTEQTTLQHFQSKVQKMYHDLNVSVC